MSQEVMATNDDAASCKRYAVSAGYWNDPYLQYFVKLPERKAPEINRGYFARVRGVKYLLDQFLASCSSCQIVSLGAGFDTLYWRLKDEGVTVQSFVELDLPGVTSKKCHFIRTRKQLLSSLVTEDEEVKFSASELHAGRYHLVGADLQNTSEVEEKLLRESGLDPALPTAFLAECVLIYVQLSQSTDLLKWIASHFQNVLFINYEQVNMGDKFGAVMIENLRKRCWELVGVEACANLETQKERFVASGWDSVKAWDMTTVYSSLPRSEVDRIENLEFLDETELLQQLLQHYCITVAYKGGEECDLSNVGFD